MSEENFAHWIKNADARLHEAWRSNQSGNKARKREILLNLMAMQPKEFFVDSDEGGHVVGLTHRSTGYKFHLPRVDVPAKIFWNPSVAVPEVEKSASYAVDLDGTLAESYDGDFDKDVIGKPVPEMLDRVKQWLKDGDEVVIFTARAASKENIPPIRAWLKEHGIEGCRITNEKTPDIEELWDDRAVAVERDTGKVLGRNKSAYDRKQLRKDIATAGEDVETNPTDAQAAAGNYAKGHVNFHGLSITIENPKGSTRHGTDRNGKHWSCLMRNHYGYIKRTEGRDGDNIDVFIGEHPDSEVVFIIDQRNPDSLRFDEHKCVLGAVSKAEAKALYLANYAKGWKGCGDITALTLSQFRNWLAKGDTSKPLAGQSLASFVKKASMWDCKGCGGKRSNLVIDHNGEVSTIRGAGTCLSCGKVGGYTSYPDKYEGEELQKLRDFQAGREKNANTTPHDYGTRYDRLRARRNPFPRPENYERIDEYSNDNLDVGVGANDWECGWSFVGIHEPGKISEEPVVWFEINHDKCPHCKGTNNNGDTPASETGKCMDWSKRVVRSFMKAAANARALKNGDWSEITKDEHSEHIGRFKRYEKNAVVEQVGDEWLLYTRDKKRILGRHPSARAAYAQEYAIQKSMEKQAAMTIPTTGPEAIAHRLAALNLDQLEADQRALIKSGKVSKRSKAVKILNIIEGLKRNKVEPSKLMINHVPVIPAIFRPFAVAGNTFIPGDANELYRDLFTVRDLHKESADELGEQGAGEARLALYRATKALYGYGNPVNPKTESRGVTGFFQKITGTNPKYSWMQRKMLSKPQDNVSRGTITINPDLGLDEIGMPEEMAWKGYSAWIQRRLVRMGYSPAEAVRAIRDKHPRAKQALEMEIKERPVVYSRAPAWHKFNTIAGNVRLTQGNTIEINPFVTTGHNADFDGDQMNVHVPASEGAVQEAYEKLMPSKMVFTIRDPDKVMPNLKHEQVLSLFSATQRPAKSTWQFGSQAEALDAIKKGQVSLSDEIVFPGVEQLGQ